MHTKTTPGNSDKPNMVKTTELPESFAVDHRQMSAPQVRKAVVHTSPGGDRISKFDLRFVKPNYAALPTSAMHTLEHLLAVYLREHLEGVIDLSPMCCRTGFYLTVWGTPDTESIRSALKESLRRVVQTEWSEVPGISEAECGNYRDHSLFSAQEYAGQILKGLQDS